MRKHKANGVQIRQKIAIPFTPTASVPHEERRFNISGDNEKEFVDRFNLYVQDFRQ